MTGDEPMPPCGSPDGMDKIGRYRKDGQPRKTNKYTARCNLCDAELPPGRGALSWSDSTGWSVSCMA